MKQHVFQHLSDARAVIFQIGKQETEAPPTVLSATAARKAEAAGGELLSVLNANPPVLEKPWQLAFNLPKQ